MKTAGWGANYLRVNEVGNLGWAALTWTFIAFAVLQSFRAQGQHFWWVLVGVAVPSLRYALSHDYRQTVRGRFVDSWSSLDGFRQDPAAIPWHAAFIWVLLPFTLFFLTNTKVQVGDNAPVFLAATSVVRQGQPECSEFLHLPQWSRLGTETTGLNRCLVRTSAGIYSRYPAGPLQAAVPVALVSRLVGADLDNIKVHERLQKLTAALLSATCLGLFYLVALHLVPATPAWIGTLLLGTGSVMFTTIGVGIWQHGGFIFWTLAFLLAECRQTPDRSWKWTLLQGIALGWMLPWRPTALLVAACLGLWLLCRSPKRAIIVALVAGVAFLPWGWFYWSCYGNLLGPTHGDAQAGNWHWTSPDGFLGVLISPGRGLLVYQPWLLLATLWLWPPVRAVDQHTPPSFSLGGLMATCALAVVLNIAVIGAWSMWWGGYCYGSRLNAEVVPFAGLICLKPLAYLWNFSLGRKGVAVLLVAGFLIHGSCAYFGADQWDSSPQDVDGHPERLWRWDDPPFLYPVLKHFDRPLGTASARTEETIESNKGVP